MTPRPLRIGIVAGEASGDCLGAELMRAILAERPDARFEGTAGPGMIAQGCDALAHIEQLSVMGLVEVVQSYPRLHRLRTSLVRHFLAAPPDVFVGIDVPDFNLGLARRLKGAGIPTAHYVCPQAWAWRAGRARGLGRAVDLLLALLPFEPAFFAARGVHCVFVGHPLADVLPLVPDRSAARRALDLPLDVPVIAILPGSRTQEIERLLQPFVAGASLLARQQPQAHFIVCVARASQVEWVRRAVAAAGFSCRVVQGLAHQTLTAADAAVVASGTASLEAMLCKTPMVVGYHLAPLSYHIIRHMVKIPRIALPNILAGYALVPELIQDALSPVAIHRALREWLEQPDKRERFAAVSRELHEQLRGDAAHQAARAVLQLMRQ